ncbi:polyglutamylase, putative [Ixodes scapularis]|uniref:Polyglutamylase, putative n=1 Tax=Ixodes scapularis TaxID=6945 RepID=B7Q6X9_IXOSC|nr:polyglutamylase, putative [Ixodes scapularis]|eukprot:XP_002403461.1 polyglutamylase, putative [Ixodes scapularis]
MVLMGQGSPSGQAPDGYETGVQARGDWERLTLAAEDPRDDCPLQRLHSLKHLKSPFRRSLFPGVPPTLHFYTEDIEVLPLPPAIRRQLRWKVTSITPLLIRQTVVRFHLGRKDKLWQNVCRRGGGALRGPSMPLTFLLPQQLAACKEAWAEEEDPHCWILKPPASARGAGVHVVHKWSQVPKKQPLIVQRYIRSPYLINGTKFDLRLYALVTSFDPLRVYVARDGLVRFASIRYSQECEDFGDRFMHLTNYSINKKSATYASNTSKDDCEGHKWSIKALQKYLEDFGVDFEHLWQQMVDIIVKTLICCEGPINRLTQKHTTTRYNCYELFGFDILLDESLKPWLLEVNVSPRLRSATPVDFGVKSEIVKDLLNLVGFQLPQLMRSNFDMSLLAFYGLNDDNITMNPVLHSYALSAEERLKHKHYETLLEDDGILERLTPDDVRQLVSSEDELSRRGSFERVLPSACERGRLLLQGPFRRYYNVLLSAWEFRFGQERRAGEHPYLVLKVNS